MTAKERPIILRDWEVRAILRNEKTQFRRIVDRLTGIGRVTEFQRSTAPRLDFTFRDSRKRWHDLTEAEVLERCPFGRRLWVREAFSGPHCMDAAPGSAAAPPSKWGRGRSSRIWYWADGSPQDGDWTKPKPSIHMPRWASRITLEITGVRVERLQEISYEDAVAEGARPGGYGNRDGTAEREFRRQWELDHGPGSWDANPWVWAVSFRRAET